VLEQEGDKGRARLQPRAQLAERVNRDAAAVSAQSALGRAASLGGIEPKEQQWRDDAARAGSPQVHRHQLAGFGIVRHEERVEDSHGASALDPFERPQQSAFEVGARPESVDQELRARRRGVTGHNFKLDG
jgi:hypothetical protein